MRDKEPLSPPSWGDGLLQAGPGVSRGYTQTKNIMNLYYHCHEETGYYKMAQGYLYTHKRICTCSKSIQHHKQPIKLSYHHQLLKLKMMVGSRDIFFFWFASNQGSHFYQPQIFLGVNSITFYIIKLNLGEFQNHGLPLLSMRCVRHCKEVFIHSAYTTYSQSKIYKSNARALFLYNCTSNICLAQCWCEHECHVRLIFWV